MTGSGDEASYPRVTLQLLEAARGNGIMWDTGLSSGNLERHES